ncbi:MAG: hypothetical protein JO328_10870 [Hyphomicrobiales bacterium]|nr:hypothetical protein [Hyphomicrobiales bacterium]MBV8827150.1 hypothetical protein [Hyphomicrobiales bacterium]MBV9427952.1 hypothetical protein [Bradyrhizobiaceae bacterium]
MPWQLQPLIWPFIIATLALLAMPRPAHPQSKALIKACYRTVYEQCHDQVKALDRKATGECVKAKFDMLAPRCRALIEKEFPEVKETK